MKKIVRLFLVALMICAVFMFGMEPVLARDGIGLPGESEEFNESEYKMNIMDEHWRNGCSESGKCGDDASFVYSDGKLVISGSGKIDNWAFANYVEIKQVTINEGITIIGKEAFSQCTHLESATMPSSLTTIEEYAFNTCVALESVTIPNGVKEIGEFAFAFCKYALKSITIPDSVTKIGNSAFLHCQVLEKITIQNGGANLGRNAFGGCSENFTLISYKGGEVEKYAKDNDINFKDIDNPTGSIISNGNIYIIIATAVVVIGLAMALIVVKNKKKSALADGNGNKNESDL